jgi:hypothetical protein
MFLRCKRRRKDGKEHLYWSVVENRRISGGRFLQRQVLYLREINGRQEAAWRKTLEINGQDPGQPSQVALFDEWNRLRCLLQTICQIRITGDT